VEHLDVIRHNSSEHYTLSPRIRLEPGLVFFATKRIGIEATLGAIGYSFTRSKIKSTTDGVEQTKYSATDKLFTASFSPARINLGIQFYLNTK
jgi:hypothetical protein